MLENSPPPKNKNPQVCHLIKSQNGGIYSKGSIYIFFLLFEMTTNKNIIVSMMNPLTRNGFPMVSETAPEMNEPATAPKEKKA